MFQWFPKYSVFHIFILGRLADGNSYIHTPMAAAATQGADQHIRGSLGFSNWPKDATTCRTGESKTAILLMTRRWLYLQATAALFELFSPFKSMEEVKNWVKLLRSSSFCFFIRTFTKYLPYIHMASIFAWCHAWGRLLECWENVVLPCSKVQVVKI